ncbi:hypothetical protein TPHA_0E02330 [Tetrapisispora phaffii CBS 4417]|uniref:Uncharacterized protein n=1 Tax=Tetrapisispora phaffii (strain ATCC 24235 / CBS 4417 / NBRC 1672 / NRRL Y-8282 / UCD 70-5) TaxID=1071381 RepID=G8BTU7_TETPH|nr:hypothetical protein TPHA_0E02330 [Tetrapisispora phaffii CBS 4417]CCE63325.1 hypothetical protein TPHA_0E02330 [Tetrapisispora phaffii CBS 4417]
MSFSLLFDYEMNFCIESRYKDLTNNRITLFASQNVNKTGLLYKFLRYPRSPPENTKEDIYKLNLLLSSVSKILKENSRCDTTTIIKQNRKLIKYLMDRKSVNAFQIQILDTDTSTDSSYSSSNFEFNELKIMQIKQSDVFVLCYNASDIDSLYELKRCYINIVACFDNLKDMIPPIYFVGLQDENSYPLATLNNDPVTFFNDLGIDINTYPYLVQISELNATSDSYKSLLVKIILSAIKFKIEREKLIEPNEVESNQNVNNNNNNNRISAKIQNKVQTNSILTNTFDHNVADTDIAPNSTTAIHSNEVSSNKRTVVRKTRSIQKENLHKNPCCIIC